MSKRSKAPKQSTQPTPSRPTQEADPARRGLTLKLFGPDLKLLDYVQAYPEFRMEGIDPPPEADLSVRIDRLGGTKSGDSSKKTRRKR
jgi:hypothetical protein